MPSSQSRTCCARPEAHCRGGEEVEIPSTFARAVDRLHEAAGGKVAPDEEAARQGDALPRQRRVEAQRSRSRRRPRARSMSRPKAASRKAGQRSWVSCSSVTRDRAAEAKARIAFRGGRSDSTDTVDFLHPRGSRAGSPGQRNSLICETTRQPARRGARHRTASGSASCPPPARGRRWPGISAVSG